MGRTGGDWGQFYFPFGPEERDRGFEFCGQTALSSAMSISIWPPLPWCRSMTAPNLNQMLARRCWFGVVFQVGKPWPNAAGVLGRKQCPGSRFGEQSSPTTRFLVRRLYRSPGPMGEYSDPIAPAKGMATRKPEYLPNSALLESPIPEGDVRRHHRTRKQGLMQIAQVMAPAIRSGEADLLRPRGWAKESAGREWRCSAQADFYRGARSKNGGGEKARRVRIFELAGQNFARLRPSTRAMPAAYALVF